MKIEEVREKVNALLKNKKYDEIKDFLLLHKELAEKDNDLASICYLCTIYEKERKASQETIFSKVSDIDELLERYTKLKFYLRRIDFDLITDEEMKSFYQFLTVNRISSYELLTVIEFSVVHKEKVLKSVKGEKKFVKPDETSIKRVDDNEHNKEICFIICTNNKLYADECLHYINHLEIPDGYHIDVLTVENAHSMTSGYNEAMEYSDAKYKVYLHQDTFIINTHFIQDCLEIFQNDSKIGMIGNVGVPKMPKSGIMWDADRFGMLYEQHIYETALLKNGIEKRTNKGYLEVEAIDGFIMVTQYDIPWRDDLFDKWDFYDCSQSMEFIRKGYKVVIPKMTQPWCVHDCGFINLTGYDYERNKFIKEYL